MSFPRIVSASCRACKTPLLRSFASSTANHAGVAPLRASWAAPPASFRRPFTSASDSTEAAAAPDALEHTQAAEPAIVESAIPESTTAIEAMSAADAAPHEPTDAEADAEADALEEESPSEPVPWYLQNAPSRPIADVTAHSLIPALPENPPPLLATLLEYLSITAGLDDLALYDLRKLDPPPALGTKLIMLIGTARSEKHLHVSADRMCRHLRREYGLKANAAGLLGRNELKIKLRRKAKRMKMLANVGGGNSEETEGNLDDGIRTAWICCTLGRIEAHPLDTALPGTDDDFVGFRDIKSGVNVVVQMFTEEKRGEIDLETLWGGVLKSQQRQDDQADEMLKELEEFVDEVQEKRDEQDFKDQKRMEHLNALAPSRQRRFDRPSAPSHDAARQVRGLHTVGLPASL